MGLIVDTSTLVSAERRGHTVQELFEQLQTAYGHTRTGLSAVTLVEMAHGIERAKLDVQRQRRQALFDDLVADITVYPSLPRSPGLREKSEDTRRDAALSSLSRIC